MGKESDIKGERYYFYFVVGVGYDNALRGADQYTSFYFFCWIASSISEGRYVEAIRV